ncbi:MAG: DNA polymerase III subunit delta [Candidatus Berkiellales bacterium]
MRCYPEALSTTLKKSFPVYVIYGNEPFLMAQSADLILQILKANAEIEHQIFTIDTHAASAWAPLIQAKQNRSLFSQKRLFELRFLTNINADEAQQLIHLLPSIDENSIFLIQAGQLSLPQQKAKWFIHCEQVGLVVPHKPLAPPQFSKWVTERAKHHRIKFTTETLKLLIDYTEGNCLAAEQEMTRLALYYAEGDKEGDKTVVITDLDQQSQFNVFDLCKAAVAQKPERVIKILRCLKDAGTALPLIIWALAQTSREPSTAASKPFLLSRLSLADKQLKTGEMVAAWQEVMNISLLLAGGSVHSMLNRVYVNYE